MDYSVIVIACFLIVTSAYLINKRKEAEAAKDADVVVEEVKVEEE